MCVGHLNLNLSVYESQTASPSSAFAAHYQFSVAYKSLSILVVLGTHCRALQYRPPAKCYPTSLLSARTTLWESIWANLCVLYLWVCAGLCAFQHSQSNLFSFLWCWQQSITLIAAFWLACLAIWLLFGVLFLHAGVFFFSFLKLSLLMWCVLGTRLPWAIWHRFTPSLSQRNI